MANTDPKGDIDYVLSDALVFISDEEDQGIQRGVKRSAEDAALVQEDQVKPTPAKRLEIDGEPSKVELDESGPPNQVDKPAEPSQTTVTPKTTEPSPAGHKEKTYTLVDQESEIKQALANLRECSEANSLLAVDCEAEKLGRDGKLSLVAVATERHTYLFDIKTLGAKVFDEGLRHLLQDPNREKLMFDCRSDSDCLWHLYAVKLTNVLDLQLMQIIHQESDKSHPYYGRVMPRDFQRRIKGFKKCLEHYVDDQNFARIKNSGLPLMGKDGVNWMKRPLIKQLLEYAAVDVQGFFPLYCKLKSAVDTPSAKKRLQVGSQRYLDLYQSKSVRIYDKYELNAFLPWRVLPDSVNETFYRQEVTCTGCKRRFPRSDFTKTQLRLGSQKCPVCKKIDKGC
ncbi:piRNA biogenesis protein EXD1-like [Acanthaster planci]|uniref:PiRNA biogenesis protein EXD1-like n=1 Tax=Acanthaster planci TaxID=133434 RepID=A0A8B7YDQ7_ACAPL|nr:piRNA biogenesis protein EXD1-like [Acanthaster planci]XP_022090510.1 piRNA biogenesis protein EXD1-like [Acanthaster planci]